MAILSLLAAVFSLAPAMAAPKPYEINVILAMTGLAGFAGQQEAESLRALETTVNASGGIRAYPLRYR